jgi:hypothetical protein
MSDDMRDETMRGALSLPEPDETDDSNELIEVREAFAVTDFKSASWVVTRIRQARDYAAQVQAWASSEFKKARDAENFFLQSYGEQLKALAEDTTRGTNKKSINLPAGRLQLRQKPLGLEITDQAELVAWLQNNDSDCLRLKVTASCSGDKLQAIEEAAAMLEGYGLKVETSTEINKRLLNERFKETGEVPPGCEVSGGEDELYIQ